MGEKAARKKVTTEKVAAKKVAALEKAVAEKAAALKAATKHQFSRKYHSMVQVHTPKPIKKYKSVPNRKPKRRLTISDVPIYERCMAIEKQRQLRNLKAYETQHAYHRDFKANPIGYLANSRTQSARLNL